MGRNNDIFRQIEERIAKAVSEAVAKATAPLHATAELLQVEDRL
jgi:hypothetical protein